MSVQTEPIEQELVSEVREIREEISGPATRNCFAGGLLIGGLAGLVWSQRHRIAKHATGRILSAFTR